MRRAFLLASACLLALPAFAQTGPDPDASNEEPVVTDLVIVTATRIDASLKNTPGAAVLTRDDLERRGAVTLADALESVPGASVSRQGAFGGTTSVRLRGAGSDKTLVLVDGVPVNDPSQPSGAYDFGAFDLSGVDRIEVLSGPQGSLWGSDAIGGVVSITTASADRRELVVEAGSYDTRRLSARYGGSGADWGAAASVSAFQTDGVSAAANGTEADGYENLTLGLRAWRALPGNAKLEARARYVDSYAEADGYDAATFAFGDTAEVSASQTWTGRLALEAEGPGETEHALSVDALRLQRSFKGGAFPSRYTADRTVWRYQAKGTADSSWTWTAGAEREEERADLSGGDGDLGETSAFVLVERSFPGQALTLSGAARVDDPDRFDAETTFRLAAAWDAGPGLTVLASFGQGFKTPTVSQALCDFCFPAGPATDLKPERAEGVDLGLRWTSGDRRTEASAAVYRLDVEDQITYVGGRYRNLARARSTGLELSAEHRLDRSWSLEAGYGWTETEDLDTGLPLPRVPEHAGSVAVFRTGERWNAGLIVRAEGEQADVDPSTFATATREGFVTADLTGSVSLTEGAELTLRVENLTDAEVQETLGYGEAGRSAYVGIRLRY